MILGFIGTGKISSSVITGICNSKISFKKILISPRNKFLSKKLSKKFKKVKIAKNNQQIINQSNWVFLAITPDVGNKIIKNLKFKKNQKIISFISTISLGNLKRMIKVKCDIVIAIPLPPISIKKGPIPIYPPNKKIKNFFNKIGSVIEIQNEKLSINFWSTSGMMASYYNIGLLSLVRISNHPRKMRNWTALQVELSPFSEPGVGVADAVIHSRLSQLISR